MTTILTEITEKEQQKLLIEKSNQTYSSLQLNVTNEKELPAKYISTANTIETKQELTNRSRILRNKEDNSSIYHIFLKSILYTLHFVYIFFTSIRLLNTYLYNLYISTRYDDIRKRIQHDKLQLTKIPNHLTIIISRELLSTRSCQDWERIMSEISTLTCWAYEFGTKEISVYDATGVLKSMAVKLHEQQSTALNDWKNKFELTKEEKNKPEIKFSILSSENGKPYIGRVTQQLACNHLNDNIDINLVNQYMHIDTISDPDLMIIFDGLPHNYISLDDYPPWHIRLTEMMNCFNCHYLDYNLFSKCLYKFSKVEQRLGR